MKRIAAVVGPTPSFVRWAIRQDCPFRKIETDHLPYQTFLQLRGLREVSIAYLEQRVVNGFCIHREQNQAVESARGFPVDEIINCFGDENGIRRTCGNCPANVATCVEHDPVSLASANRSGDAVWAGCYGWLAAQTETHDFPNFFEQAVTDRDSELWSCFANAQSIWFRVWQTNIWNARQLTRLAAILQMVDARLNYESGCADFVNLRMAVEACLKNDLVLETELIPSGHSDGIHWRIESHCRQCRNEMQTDCRKCGECGLPGHPQASIKRKVLGLRPYMLLKDILGTVETANLLAVFRQLKLPE